MGSDCDQTLVGGNLTKTGYTNVPDPQPHISSNSLTKWLPGAELYCSLKPCFLCAGAILHARLRRVVFGARDPKFGAVRSLATLLEDDRMNHRCEVVESVCADESAALLRTFFQARRS